MLHISCPLKFSINNNNIRILFEPIVQLRIELWFDCCSWINLFTCTSSDTCTVSVYLKYLKLMQEKILNIRILLEECVIFYTLLILRSNIVFQTET